MPLKRVRSSPLHTLSGLERPGKKAAPDATSSPPDVFEAGALISAAYPERIGKAWKEGGPGCYLLSGGEKVALDPSDILTSYEWIAVASMTSRPGGVGKVFLAAPVQEEDLEKFSTLRDTVFWDRSQGCAVASEISSWTAARFRKGCGKIL